MRYGEHTSEHDWMVCIASRATKGVLDAIMDDGHGHDKVNVEEIDAVIGVAKIVALPRATVVHSRTLSADAFLL